MKIPLHAGKERRERDIHRVIEAMKFLPLDVQMEVYIRPWRPAEKNQSNFYWFCLRTLELDLASDIEVGGWTADDWHQWAKSERGVETTKEFTIKDWTDHITWLQQTVAIRWGYALPEPE